MLSRCNKISSLGIYSIYIFIVFDCYAFSDIWILELIEIEYPRSLQYYTHVFYKQL